MEIASLGIKIENGDVIKATTSLNTMTVAGGKTEAATQRLTRRMALLEIEARNMDAAMSRSKLSIAGMAQSMGLSEANAERLSKALGALSAVAVLGFIGRKMIEETEAAQSAMAQLEAAVKSTGGAAGRTVPQLDALSISLQKQTTFSDEAVKGAEAMLLTFDQIRGTEFDRATAAITDLATRMGGDLQGAAVQVGKALQDPTTGLTALRRSGVSFSEAQIEVIKKLYETGHVAEGQRVILAELEHQFGGSAAAARDTLGGALTALKNTWGDLFEVTRGASQGTVDAINAITKSLQDSGLSMNQFVLNTVVGWEKIKAAAQKAHEVMSLPIGPGFFARAKAISERIDFDLSTKLAELNAPAKIGPAVGAAPPRSPFIDKDAVAQAKRDLAALQKATDDYYNSLNQHQIDAIKSASNSRAENDQLRELIAATQDSQDAVERVTIAQAGANAVKELGVGVSGAVAAAVRREAEEHARLGIELGHVQDAQADATREAERAADAAQRQMEQRAKELHRTISSTIEGIFTDIDQHRNPFVAIFDNLKRGAIKAISDILATKIEGTIGDFLGIQTPASKQEKAAREMNIAADKMLRAGQQMNDSVPGDGLVDSSQSDRKVLGIGVEQWKKAMGIGAVAYGSFQAGQGIGQATGDKALGALGGAASGVAAGAAFGPLGMAVGGIAGAVGGLLGAARAAEEARRRLEEAKKAWTNLRDSLTAEFNKDDEAAQIAQINARYDEARKIFAASDPLGAAFASSGGLAKLFDGGAESAKKFADELARLGVEQQARIAQIREEIAIFRGRQREDYQQRFDEATPGNERAEAIAAFNRKEDRELEDLKRSFGPVIDAQEAATYAIAQQAIAAEEAKFATEQNTKAVDALTTSLHNAPIGYKYQQYAYDFGVPTTMGGPRSPLRPPSGPSFSQGGRPISITFAPQIDGTKATRTLAKDLANEFKKVVVETLGSNADPADGIGLLVS